MRQGKRFFFEEKKQKTFALLALFWAASASAQDISLSVAQSGADSGIRNRLFTTWLPPGQAFDGLSGRISLAGNAPGFSEALVLLGASADGRAACAARNGTVLAGVPPVARLWAGILKANDATPVGLSVSFRLPRPVPPSSPAGTCLLTVVSAGYPFLRRDAALYTSTTVRLTVATAAAAPPPVQVFGIGGEFRFSLAALGGSANYVGIQARRTLGVDAIAVALSAAPVAGAPPAAGWGRSVEGAWRVTTAFLVLPAPACTAAGLTRRQPGADYDVIRLGTPAAMARPAGRRTLFEATLAGTGMAAAQRSGFVAPATRLDPGDCLIAFTSVPQAGQGLIDAENQSTLYLH